MHAKDRILVLRLDRLQEQPTVLLPDAVSPNFAGIEIRSGCHGNNNELI